MRYPILLGILLFSFGNSIILNAQSVMLIPFNKQGESKRLISDNDPCYRIIETKIAQTFSKKADYRFYNARAAADRIENFDEIINSISQVDLIALLVQNANPDIYIVVDYEITQNSNNSGASKMTINLKAYRTSDSFEQAFTILDSGWRYTTDCVGLTTKAFFNRDTPGGEYNIDVFVEELISQINVPTQAVNIEFFLSKETKLNYLTKLDNGQLLAQAINTWIEEHLVSQQDNNDITPTYLEFPSVILDLGSEKTTPSGIAFALYGYLSELKLEDRNKLSFLFSTTGQNIIFHLQ